MSYQAGNQWAKHFQASGISYPAEYLIRIFRGTYPNLKMPKPKCGQRALDVGCGDGRHVLYMHSLGLEAHGVEISEQLVAILRSNLEKHEIPPDQLQVGSCAALPHPDSSFDYVVAWNSSYYMSLDSKNYETHAAELLRVLKPGGWLVLSVPKSSAFIFADSGPSDRPGYRVIRNDPFLTRNGEIMRCFGSREELASVYSNFTDSACYADIHDDCFGFAYHWYLLVACKK